ncbi:hypothetical protein SDC9_145878 [bioreactor metagenome]|uniref:Uncharacterized protein n=1 Tax=bioreactor metagenome TaxID=1076179 RepID=A0A645EA72_9ZZZZ|nr:hypothetical protein [Candidatus Metalachnospira sp.]
MYNYAQLGSNNICIAVSQLSNEVQAANMISIDSADYTLLGKRYNNGIWEEVETPLLVQPATQQDKIEAGIDYLIMLSQ